MAAVAGGAKTIRAEIRGIVDDAKARGRPITSNIIWGLLAREVPEDSCKNLLSMMVRAHQVVRVKQGDGQPSSYEPGPVPVRDHGSRERFSMMMGNREHGRLEKARDQARKWRRSGG